MATHYSQGTVVPYLPVSSPYLKALRWLRGEIDECPDDALGVIPGDWLTNDDDPTPTENISDAATGLGFESTSPGQFYFFLENGAEDFTAEILQWLLQGAPEEIEYLTVEGAYTCSRLRPGALGGWAWFITRNYMTEIGTGQWLYEQVSALKEAQAQEQLPEDNPTEDAGEVLGIPPEE